MRSVITLLIYLTVGLMTSMANEKSGDETYSGFINKLYADTLINNLFINVDSFNLNIIQPSSGVQFYREGILFLSSTKSSGRSLPDHISFGTISSRYGILNESLLERSEPFSNSSSFANPSEGVTFSVDYNTMYFSGISNIDGGEKIYHAKYSEGNPGDWTLDSEPVSFCSDKSVYTHPALSADGKMMVFASNKPGSLGGMDLFVSLEKNGKWSDPVNLGDAVNSSFNELYPFLDSENNLFFSSDNTQGFGGYDIYVCKFKSNTWEKPINLSSPVNTRFDDVAFTISRKDGKTAFYTVKENPGKRPVQLYRVSMNNDSQSTFLTLSQYYTRPDISQMVILALEPAVQATDKTSETAASGSAGGNVVYRVQFVTSFNPKTRSQINVGGTDYSVFEYLYSGAYRLCVGEFSSLAPALDLQNLLVKSDYPNASVVAFKNNVLSLDPELLKSPTVTAQKPAVEPQDVTAQLTGTKPAEAPAITAAKLTPATDVKKNETVKTTPSTEAKKSVPVATAATAATVAAIPATSENKGSVVYRVQIFSGGTGGSTKVKVADKTYMTYEYKYSGTYRTCLGEFSSLTPAKDFQNLCRKNGYAQAFVVAFKDNVRSTDPALFK
jgi:hypothetical protein